MGTYLFSEIASMLHVVPKQQHSDVRVDSLLTDSRKLLFPESTLFFAISSPRKDANLFVPELYARGVRCFAVDKKFSLRSGKMPEANILVCEDVLSALQQLASLHRHHFSIPVIGITGSNGKTIVKEWLHQLLGETHKPVQSPKSYNSQVGVPLSVWQLHEGNDISIFEAGISRPGEMQRLRSIIDPSVGIVTCIGEAHANGFISKAQKTDEKLSLFINSKVLIYGVDDKELAASVNAFVAKQNTALELFSWGHSANARLRIVHIEKADRKSRIDLTYSGQEFSVQIPFADEASVQNAVTCCATLLYLNIKPEAFIPWMTHLRPVEMRLELKQGLNDCVLINDSYSADINSISVALDFLYQQQQFPRKTVILSDLFESGKEPSVLYAQIAGILGKRDLYRFIGIGSVIKSQASAFTSVKQSLFFDSTDEFLKALPGLNFQDEAILLKGARVFRFEKISHALQQKMHETVLQINLQAIRHNLKVYREFLRPGTAVMAMVKAFSYGSGSVEIANLLQHAGVEYLAVAYADEGNELRKAGIHLPIMVMNPEEAGFEQLTKRDLEPEIYSMSMLLAFRNFLQQQGIRQYPIHIELDSGMHRLGFMASDIPELCRMLPGMPEVMIRSVFSHLAASSEAEHDSFTKDQINQFNELSSSIRKAVGYDFIRHIANSGAIHRHASAQFDMVRLGIGLYGVDPDPSVQPLLQNVSTLRTTISQIKKIHAGESIGYSRKAIASNDMKIAVVRIGYADGYPRSLSNGVGKMLVNNIPVPVVGNICMDMTMLDITGMDAAEGDEVIVFGEFLPVSLLADWAGTIPYEILTGISQRVRRDYFEE